MLKNYAIPIIFACIIAPITVHSAPRTADQEADRIRTYCLKSTTYKAAAEQCLHDQVERIEARLAAAVRKKKFEIGDIANTKPEIGTLSGKGEAEKWLKSFNIEQDIWSVYYKSRCENVLNYENYGGSGAGGAMAACSLSLALRRISEIEN